MQNSVYHARIRSYNLGQNKWNIWTTPPLLFQRYQNGAVLLFRAFFITLGGGGGGELIKLFLFSLSKNVAV